MQSRIRPPKLCGRPFASNSSVKPPEAQIQLSDKSRPQDHSGISDASAIAVVALRESKKFGPKMQSDVLYNATPSPVVQIDSKQAHENNAESDENCPPEKSTPCAVFSPVVQALPCGDENYDAHAKLCETPAKPKSPGHDADEWADISSGDLFCEVAQELDRWEKELEHNRNVSLSPGGLTEPRVSPSHVSGVSACLHTSGLRSGVVTHMAPVTVLPPAASAQCGLTDPVKGFYGTDKGPARTWNGKTPGLLGVSPSTLVRHDAGCCNVDIRTTPRLQSASPGALVCHTTGGCLARTSPVEDVSDSPLLFPAIEQQKRAHIEGHTLCKSGSSSIARKRPLTIQETPPLEQGSTVPSPTVMSCSGGKGSSLGTQINDSTHSGVSSASGEGTFKTPNISRWLNSKRCTNNSSPLPSSFGFVSSGGKVTPPLCGCGRRAKRKFVCSPGPNEGLPFYVCPNSRGNDRKLGCNYFKWERRESDCSNSDEPLLSDYGECR